MRGPGVLFAAWLIHDAEEAVAFPGTAAHLAEVTGIDALRMNTAQSVTAIGLMGGIVGLSCWRGARTGGRSRSYRAVLSGLEAHVGTHVLSSIVLWRYTAGVVTAIPIMWPGAVIARRELARRAIPLQGLETWTGPLSLALAALACQSAARVLVRSEIK